MIARVIEIKNKAQAEAEIKAIGADAASLKFMSPKSVNQAVKLKNVRVIAANIIKQEMLSFGGEAAVAYGAINNSVKETDVLIFGNLKQFGLLTEKLKEHQFGLPKISEEIMLGLNNYAALVPPFKIGGRTFAFGKRTYLMGILNVTPDSFSDGGRFLRIEDAVARAEKMLEEGADIIDVGGESTRPGAKAVSAEEEIKRVVPVIRKLGRIKGAVVSVDTRRAEVARAVLDAGADMVNDVSALRFDKNMLKILLCYKVPVCLMHMRGNPLNMQDKPAYKDLLGEIIDYLGLSLAIAASAGILLGKIMIDPGIGFGKTVEHNLEILRKLRELRVLGCPVMVGPSRKSFIGQTLDLPVEERMEGTSAAVAIAIANGADFVRVHDVKEMRRVVCMSDAIIRKE